MVHPDMGRLCHNSIKVFSASLNGAKKYDYNMKGFKTVGMLESMFKKIIYIMHIYVLATNINEYF